MLDREYLARLQILLMSCHTIQYYEVWLELLALLGDRVKT